MTKTFCDKCGTEFRQTLRQGDNEVEFSNFEVFVDDTFRVNVTAAPNNSGKICRQCVLDAIAALDMSVPSEARQVRSDDVDPGVLSPKLREDPPSIDPSLMAAETISAG